MPLPTNPSESVRRLNPHLFGGPGTVQRAAAQSLLAASRGDGVAKIIRQKSGDGLNKTERAFLAHLKSGLPVAGLVHTAEHIRPHGITLVLANGCKYTPDFFYKEQGQMRVYEIKGGHIRDDAIVKLKTACSQNRWLTFFLVQGDSKGAAWNIQEIIP